MSPLGTGGGVTHGDAVSPVGTGSPGVVPWGRAGGRSVTLRDGGHPASSPGAAVAAAVSPPPRGRGDTLGTNRVLGGDLASSSPASPRDGGDPASAVSSPRVPPQEPVLVLAGVTAGAIDLLSSSSPAAPRVPPTPVLVLAGVTAGATSACPRRCHLTGCRELSPSSPVSPQVPQRPVLVGVTPWATVTCPCPCRHRGCHHGDLSLSLRVPSQ